VTLKKGLKIKFYHKQYTIVVLFDRDTTKMYACRAGTRTMMFFGAACVSREELRQ
jgi:hypothetical protein